MNPIQASESRVPEHLPPERVWNCSLNEFNSEMEEPYVAASRLHEGHDIFLTTNVVLGRVGVVPK